MPTSPPVACVCGGRRINGRCDRCGRGKRGQHYRTTTDRGYGWDWQQFRTQYLREYPLCMDCQAEDRVAAATEVHHLIKIRDNRAMKLEPDNCMALCDRHHNERTARGE